MVLNFQDSEIKTVWTEILSSDKYTMIIEEIADNFPQKKSVNVDYSDINAYNIDFAMFLLEFPDRCIKEAKNVVMNLVPNISRPGESINVRIFNR